MAKNITPQEKNFMTIESLKHRWKKDKEFFKNKEIGELQQLRGR